MYTDSRQFAKEGQIRALEENDFNREHTAADDDNCIDLSIFSFLKSRQHSVDMF